MFTGGVMTETAIRYPRWTENEGQVSPNCPRWEDTSKGRFEPKRGHLKDTLDTFQGFLSRARIREEIGKKCPNCPYCPFIKAVILRAPNRLILNQSRKCGSGWFPFPVGIPASQSDGGNS